MVRLEEVTTVPTPIAEAFAYTAEFANIADWDPGVNAAVKRGDRVPHVGQIYDLVTVFKGSESDMVYTITELDPPHRIVLTGDGDRVVAVDAITFEETNEGTQITYVAELSFKGVARFMERPLGSTLDQLGRDAVGGLEAALS